jgi:lipopolysaccharide transport system ATP-binding protein
MSWSIQVDNLSKRYRLGRSQTQKFESFYELVTDVVLDAAERVTRGRSRKYLPARIQAKPPEIQSEHMVLAESQFEGAPPGHFFALKDVSFRVEEGQRIGIIGKNGSGKSTLLKILSRITRPTEGSFKFRGRLISLLEIGTGFHPDLTGRENVHLNAKINGMTDRQIRSVFDEIVAFSELGVQIDMPIKRYSSGMYMRLAFSVAAHLDSEILVVDEVLAVGDTGFQKKCLDRMLAIGNSGRTLLFVSHDMDAVRKLCSSALELSHGRIVSHDKLAKVEARADGKEIVASGLQSVTTAIADYSLEGKACSERLWTAADAPRVPSGRLSIRRVAALSVDGAVAREFSAAQDVSLCVELARSPAVAGCQVRVDIASSSGRPLVSSVAKIELPLHAAGSARAEVLCRIPAPFFNPGAFKASVVVSDLSDTRDMCTVHDAIDVIVAEGGVREPGLARAPDAPLSPLFTWTAREGEASADDPVATAARREDGSG